jgi:hypothetical protein
MKRTAALRFGSCHKPRSDEVGGSLPPATGQNAAPKANRPPVRHRSDLCPPERPARSRRRIARQIAKLVEPAWEVLDDLPEVVPVTKTEIRVIETYLAALLNERE